MLESELQKECPRRRVSSSLVTRWMYWFCLVLCVTLSAYAQAVPDPLSGTWEGRWRLATHLNQVILELKWDGKTLKGTINPGPDSVKISKTSFDPSPGSVHMEADAVGKKEMAGKKLHYIIEGKLENGVLAGSWSHDNVRGQFTLTKKKR